MATIDLSLLAAKSSKDDAFLGWALEQFSKSYDYSTANLADYLGCSEEQLHKLALCLLPHENDQQFLSKVERISSRFEIEPSKLLQLIRESTAIARLVTNQRSAIETMLLAARDKASSEVKDDEE
jgi:hypothetical protein